jgi:DNA-directed RNA polymerase subunit RPC12/RpoP
MPIHPNDQIAANEDAEDELKPKQKRDKNGVMRTVGRRYEFDCPECDANNPWEEGFQEEDEVRCHYCAQDLRVVALEANRIKWKLL